MEALKASNIDTTIFFYNPNIHPEPEYELRKQENIRFAKKLICLLSMLIMIKMLGLKELRARKMSPREGSAAQRVLTCALR
jgi:predicted adenine nucleotide alpha hydrolase (AANH) superfamily ATPase